MLRYNQINWTYTYYALDASGNVMAVYDRSLKTSGGNIDEKYTVKEQDLYASMRVGMKHPLNDDGSAMVCAGIHFTPGSTNGDGTINISGTPTSLTTSPLPSGMRWMTRKNYELGNHLGNVYAVVTDKKMGIGNTTTSSTNTVAYYKADVISATDYFAFGAPENGRIFNSTDYSECDSMKMKPISCYFCFPIDTAGNNPLHTPIPYPFNIENQPE